MNALSILWMQSSVAAGSPPPPPLGWKMDLLVSDGGPPKWGCAGYAAVVLDFSTGAWDYEPLREQLRTTEHAPLLVLYDPRNVAPGGAAADWRVSSSASLFPRLSRLVEEHQAGVAKDPLHEDWERLLVGESHAMRQVAHLIRMVGGRRATVLITGETGSGKEVAARALHLAGARRRGPLVAFNSSAVPENLLEAELFGHVRGAFTGATQSRVGRFEAAHGGTLFLDEIGDMPLDLQAKLLRALQEREIQRLGSCETIRVDVRVVAATNCDLRQRIQEGRFREDLFYRLNVVPIYLPPLRDRREDIPALAAHFAHKICLTEHIPAKRLTAEALDLLRSHSWPGNVRELENALEAAIILSGERAQLGPGDFPLSASRPPALSVPPFVDVPDTGLDYEHTVARIERSILDQALQKTGGNKKAAAQMLGLKRTTLAAKVRSLDAMESWAARN